MSECKYYLLTLYDCSHGLAVSSMFCCCWHLLLYAAVMVCVCVCVCVCDNFLKTSGFRPWSKFSDVDNFSVLNCKLSPTLTLSVMSLPGTQLPGWRYASYTATHTRLYAHARTHTLTCTHTHPHLHTNTHTHTLSN